MQVATSSAAPDQRDPANVYNARYVSLRSYRRDGTPVDTPVWQVVIDGKLLVFTDGTSYKVKRVGRDPTVQVARCDVRGRLLGPWVAGTCRLVEPGEEIEQRTYSALIDKYGWQMRLLNLSSRLAGRYGRRRVLEISLH
ncbi:MAG: PPOX class F420-dependent oxidoreductase [Myxococcales bacterium]|nr:PPOX class F420-dependent oxidoreductase [Myxococcales bacterium]MDD9968373.1 PPOX class F420-dependent oxidoreductase [Myxococcales bacterium]